MTGSIGRFEIRRELGRGAQSVVYLAWDPRLEREVAVKTLHFAAAERRQNAALLAEARTVGRLRHPGIVPVFEAGEEEGDLYLVFEYVPGESLAAMMRRRGALPAPEAVALTVAILTALAAAHADGIVHRDLKPSNVLLDTDGNPRVMDFGIASQISSGGAENGAARGLSGTPGYMAPEYIRKREISPRNDVFAAGVMLLEMLGGERIGREADARRTMERTASVPITLPADAAPIEEPLAAIALRAVSLDPAARFQDAGEFRLALDAWLKPATAEADDTPHSGAVDFLVRRLRHRGDFPALSESVVAINRIASSESETISTLSGLILRDFSLTNKLLRLVNSVHYRPAGGGRISTVSRAIVVLGFDAVRNIAITVLLFEHLQNKANASLLKEEFLRACLAGLFARDLGTRLRTRELEQAYICSVFHNLGRLVSQYYFPEESEDIRRTMQQHGCREEVAAQRVLGVGFEELGIGLARSWGFPAIILESMRKLPDGAVRKPAGAEERLRTLSACANEYCDAVLLPAAERDRALQAIAARFAAAIPLGGQDMREAMHGAVNEIRAFAQTIKVDIGRTKIGRHLAHFIGGAAVPEPAAADSLPAGAVLEQADSAETALEGQRAVDVQAVLTAGIQDISNTLVESFKLNDVLRIILETMYRAMGFKRVLLCIRDARSNEMAGRFGFGPDVTELAKQLRFSLTAQPDNVFNVATAKGVDILISNIDEPKIAPRIPDWYRRSVPSRTFVLFPLTIKGRPVALIYADKDHAGEINIGEQELALLRTLRNQAVLAIKQTG